MLPALNDGQILFFSSLFAPKSGDIVLARVNGKDLVKRLHAADGKWSLRGDNLGNTLDFEDINKESILAILLSQ